MTAAQWPTGTERTLDPILARIAEGDHDVNAKHAIALVRLEYTTGDISHVSGEICWKITDAGRARLRTLTASNSDARAPFLAALSEDALAAAAAYRDAVNARLDGEPTVTVEEEEVLRRTREHTERAFYSAVRRYPTTEAA